MYTPDRATFLALAREHNLVPVYREVIADLETPISVFMKLCGDEPGSFLLESVEGGERMARYSFLGCRPFLRFEHGGGISVETHFDPGTHEEVRTRTRTGRPLEHLRELLGRYRAPSLPGLPRFFGGAVGYLAYDTVRYVEHLPNAPADDTGLPEAVFHLTEFTAIFDHIKHRLILVASVVVGADPEGSYDRARDMLAEVVDRLRGPIPVPGGFRRRNGHKFELKANRDQADFEAAVQRAQEYIAAGDIFQVVLSQRLQAQVGAPPLDIYRTLRGINPSPYMFYLNFGDLKVIGSSPEMMVRVEDGRAEMRPIAGTMPRGRDEAEDLANEQHLLGDEKERAEHVMLVDLGRNDLGRVSRYGTVTVRDLMRVERYSHVMHIVSDVRGQLALGKDAFDAVAATFPAGTLSGAPKVRAMEIIDELEPTRRGLYGGMVGYFGYTGNMDSCITIRTIVLKGDTAYVQAGAGIVADSNPTREYHECLRKARALLKSLEMVAEGGAL